MRIIKLPAYEQGDRTALQAKAWVLIEQALLAEPAGDAKGTRDLVRALDAFEAVRVIENEGAPTEVHYLQYSGAEIVLEDAIFDRVRAAWERYAARITGANARDKIWVDVLLGVITDMPEHPAATLTEKVSFEDWQARQKDRKAAR